MGECNNEKHNRKGVYWLLHPSELASASKQTVTNQSSTPSPLAVQARNVMMIESSTQPPAPNYS